MINRIFSKPPQRRLIATAIFATVSSPVFAEAAVLEEVVVTAQKRMQSLQDVPISVSVTSGEQLDNFSIGDIAELSASIPNVTIGQNATQDSVTIRGIGSGANKRSTNNPVFGRDFDYTDAENVTATLSYDFDSVRLVSITAYTHYDYNNNIPASWVANLDTATKRYNEDHTQYSQELRLESSGDGSLEYVGE